MSEKDFDQPLTRTEIEVKEIKAMVSSLHRMIDQILENMERAEARRVTAEILDQAKTRRS